jgi:release factor glutamine methyltransferase
VTSTAPIDTVGQALARARQLGIDRLDAQLLLAHRLGRPREWVIAHDDAALPAGDVRQLADLFARRADGEPLAYLVGEREFRGLLLHVGPDVLVPRPDTETLVEWALERLSPASAAAVADLGTGSGAIALALARQRPAARITAVDASRAALAVAQGNGEQLGVAVEWLASDWFAALDGRRFALIVSNPPYVAAGDLHLAALAHEPIAALTAGSDGLDALRQIVAHAPRHLDPGGRLLLEHGHEQAPAVAELLAVAGFDELSTRRDLAGRPRCSGGRWRPAGSV